MKRGIYQGIIVCVSLLLVMVGAYAIPQLMSSNQQQIQMNPSINAMDTRNDEANDIAIETDDITFSDEDASEQGRGEDLLEVGVGGDRVTREEGDNKENQGEQLEDVQLTASETLETKDELKEEDSQEEPSGQGQSEPANSTENIETQENELPAGLSSDEEISYVKDQWVNDMIQENRQDISDSDLSVGAPIYDKLDSGYLFSLAEDGLTEDEEKEAKAYMESRLSGSELSRAIELYNKYIGLVNND